MGQGETMTAGAWIGLVAIAATVLSSVIASYVALSNKLMRLETALTGLNTRAMENREDHKEIRNTLTNHETRISKLEPE